LKYMRKDCLRINRPLRYYYQLWCNIYYLAVRIFGKKYFNYRSNIS
jgi:hypothetical protein